MLFISIQRIKRMQFLRIYFSTEFSRCNQNKLLFLKVCVYSYSIYTYIHVIKGVCIFFICVWIYSTPPPSDEEQLQNLFRNILRYVFNIAADYTTVYKCMYKNLDDQSLAADLSPDLPLTAQWSKKWLVTSKTNHSLNLM